MHLCAGRLRVNCRSYNEHLSAHVMALLAFARLSEHYRSRWRRIHSCFGQQES